ncbi:MAG TPA: hypothetical protein PLR20_03210 [Syntrophales bacterium]|nr:hypothetical protein [Syntrophales bacterium]HOX95135.1 hypothetical protein [Syntrophales bacterium]HPI56045.1 hypothetical protein [Syntrophales bacterium]HPN24065.1 hypothetical protein [Syntrophales bacterium]HQM28344.1 hypothetical protein [Syntrophales bacterium]
MYLDIHPRHTPAEVIAMRLIVLLAWPFEKLSLWLRRCTEKMHNIDLGSVDF